jgi:hypothetical protein
VRFFQTIFFLGLILGCVSLAHATTMLPPEGIDACMASGGKPGLAVMGKITQVVQPVKVGPGWDGVRCVIGEGEVLKGNAQNPEGPIAPDKPVTWDMVNSNVVANIRTCAQGMEGLFFIYGESNYGLSSFVLNGACDVPMTKGPDGQLYAAPKAIRFKSMAFRQKFMEAHPNAAKGLGVTALTGGAGAGMSAADMKTMVKYLSSQLYGAGGGSQSTGESSDQANSGKGAEGVNIIFGSGKTGGK